jgi:hypothetical protein
MDTTVANSARVANYWSGGKDYFAEDQRVADRIEARTNSAVSAAQADRALLGRVVHVLTTELDIVQILDVGAGLPVKRGENTHELARAARSDARVVYVDADDVAVTHGRALLMSGSAGACAYVKADLVKPEQVLTEAGATLDFDRPIGLLLFRVLEHVGKEDDPYAIVNELTSALAVGSVLAINHASQARNGAASEGAAAIWNQAKASPPLTLRSPEEIAAFFDGLTLMAPGVVPSPEWRETEDEKIKQSREVDDFCGVAVKEGASG